MIPEKNRVWDKRQKVFQWDKLEIAAQTDIGLIRNTNQDRYGSHLLLDGTVLMALADGLGGEPGGEIASGYLIKSLKSLTALDPETPIDTLVSFFNKMDQDLTHMAEKERALNGMASTLIIAAVKGNRAYWVHSGDSRLYHWSAGRFTRLTQDQTLACFLVQEGEITEDQAKTHYSSHVLDQCIGCRALTPETGRILLKARDMLVLVSDGCYRNVPDTLMGQVCSRAGTPARAAEALVGLALDAGGQDNITVVMGKLH